MNVEWDFEYEDIRDFHNLSTRIVVGKRLKVDGVPVTIASDASIEEARAFFFDRWNWETGNQNDREIFETLDAEIEARKERMASGRRMRINWTVETPQDLESVWGIDVEEELTKALSEEIIKEVAEDLKVSENEKLMEKLRKTIKQ